jgi:hypothetical protein
MSLNLLSLSSLEYLMLFTLDISALRLTIDSSEIEILNRNSIHTWHHNLVTLFVTAVNKTYTESHIIWMLGNTKMHQRWRVFWDVASCRLVCSDRPFRGARCLHHQGRAMKHRSISTKVHRVTTQKLVIHILAATRTWNLNQKCPFSYRKSKPGSRVRTLLNGRSWLTCIHK